MSVFLSKVLWFQVDKPDDPINITDSLDMNAGRGIDIKNNVAVINLKNPADRLNINEKILQKHINIDSDGLIKFKENDQIKIYARYTNDMADVESVEWNNNPKNHSGNVIAEPSSVFLLGVYYILDVNPAQNIKGTPIQLKCADKSFILFNKVWAFSYSQIKGFTAPTAIQNIIRQNTRSDNGIYQGTGADSEVRYDIDARLVSETNSAGTGYIQDTRRSTDEEGNPQTGGTAFPVISMSKVWKPIYEWMNELSELENVNFPDELVTGVTPVYGKPFIMWVDEKNRFHWIETNDTSNGIIDIGTTKHVHSYKFTKSIFDVINFIVFRAGEDLLGNGVLGYHVDSRTNVTATKMRVVAMTDIGKTLIDEEERIGNLVENSSGSFTYSARSLKYNLKAGGTAIPHWATAVVSGTAAYNISLRKKMRADGVTRATNLINRLAGARYKGTLERKGTAVTVGNLLTFTNTRTGIVQEDMRIMDVRYTLNKTGYFQSLTLEQDPLAITEGK